MFYSTINLRIILLFVLSTTIFINSCKQKSPDEYGTNKMGYKQGVSHVKIQKFEALETANGIEIGNPYREQDPFRLDKEMDSVIHFNQNGTVAFVQEMDSSGMVNYWASYFYDEKNNVVKKQDSSIYSIREYKYYYKDSFKLDIVKQYSNEGELEWTKFYRYNIQGKQSEIASYYFKEDKTSKLSSKQEFDYLNNGNYILKESNYWGENTPQNVKVKYFNSNGLVLETGSNSQMTFSDENGDPIVSQKEYSNRCFLMELTGYRGSEIFKYEDGRKIYSWLVTKDETRGGKVFIQSETEFIYDSEGLLVKEISKPQIALFGPMTITTYSYDFDSRDNWVRRTKSVNGIAKTIKLRTISYFDNEKR